MKGGDVGNLLAAASFIGKDLSQDIWVVGTANEELDGKGSEDFARYFSENWSYDSACCIIAEPTDLEKIYIGQRGNHFMKLHFFWEGWSCFGTRTFSAKRFRGGYLFSRKY